MEHKTRVLQFRATAEQERALNELATATGKDRAQVLRDLVDSAVLFRPVLFSTYGQTAPVNRNEALRNAP